MEKLLASCDYENDFNYAVDNFKSFAKNFNIFE